MANTIQRSSHRPNNRSKRLAGNAARSAPDPLDLVAKLLELGDHAFPLVALNFDSAVLDRPTGAASLLEHRGEFTNGVVGERQIEDGRHAFTAASCRLPPDFQGNGLLGRLLFRRGRRAGFDRLTRTLAAARPNVGEYQSGLAASTTNLANLSRDAGDLKGAADQYTRAERLLLELRSTGDSPTRYDRDLAETLRNLAYTRQHLLQLDEAKAIYLRLIPLEESILARSPVDPQAMLSLAASQHNFGEMLHYLRDLPAAKSRLARAVELRGKAADARPSVTEFRSDLAHSQTSLGDVLSDLGEAAAAESIQKAALNTRESLAVQHPDVVDYKIRLVKSLRAVARWAVTRKGWSIAHRHLDRADSILAAIDGQHVAELRRNRGYLQDSQVDLLTREAADHASRDRWGDAISRLERVAAFPNSWPGLQVAAIKEWTIIAEARPADRDRCYSGITTLLASLLAQQRLSAAQLNELRAADRMRAYLASPAAKPIVAHLADPQPRAIARQRQ
jgi:tetratricopeptide (TPR) repeat protein